MEFSPLFDDCMKMSTAGCTISDKNLDWLQPYHYQRSSEDNTWRLLVSCFLWFWRFRWLQRNERDMAIGGWKWRSIWFTKPDEDSCD